MRFHLSCMMLALTLAGCASPNPSLYTLEPVRGTAHGGAPSVIVVRVVDIPRYLERQEIVRFTDHGHVVVADNDWWSEPLKLMLQRVTAEDLTQRLPASNVLSGESALGAPPDVDVVISLRQLDRRSDGQVALTGLAALRYRDRPEYLEPLRIVVQGSGPAITAQVGAMSLALAGAADAIAAALAK